MDLVIQFILAILPILLIFVGLVFLKQSGTLMGIVGWLLTVILAILFFQTSPDIALYASWSGVLSSFGISLMVLFTILQVTMMDVTGAITRITGVHQVHCGRAVRTDHDPERRVRVVPGISRCNTGYDAAADHAGTRFLPACCGCTAVSWI